jgi:hypothetical protein
MLPKGYIVRKPSRWISILIRTFLSYKGSRTNVACARYDASADDFSQLAAIYGHSALVPPSRKWIALSVRVSLPSIKRNHGTYIGSAFRV